MSEPLVVNSLAFEHFALSRERQVLPLARQGLVLLQGLNLVSAAADSNGCGKTSVLDALCFNWFGRRLDGKRGDVVACRFTDAQALTVTQLSDPLGPWSITRGARPKRLEVAGVRDLPDDADDATVQGMIEARLGFGYRTFCNAIVFAAGDFNRFVHADQADQMRMLDEIQGVDFREQLKRAKEWRGWLQVQLDALEARRREIEQQRGVLADQAATLEDAEARFQATKAEDLTTARRAEADARSEYEEAKRALDLLLNTRATVQTLRTRWDALQAASDSAATARADHAGAAAAADEAAAKLEEHDASIRDLLQHAQCPACRGDVKGVKAKKRIQDAFAPDRKRLQADLRTKHVVTQETERELARHVRLVEAVARALPENLDERVLRRQEDAVSAYAERLLRERVKTAELTHDARCMDLETVEARRWEGAEANAAAQATLDQLHLETARLTAEHDRKARLLKVADYWVEAFGDRGLRSLLFEGVSPFLAQRVAAHLHGLTAGEARMVISSRRDLKKGGTREQLTFRPEWTWGAVDDGSRGQDRRMDLALFAALQDLAEMQSARAFPLKAWDEPGDALDGLGRDIFVEWLGREARMRGTGFLVTHSHEAAATAGADAVWTVVLDHDGARVEFDDVVRRPGTRRRPVPPDGVTTGHHPVRRPAVPAAGAGRAAKTGQR